MKRKFRVRKHQEFDSIIRQGHFVKSHHFVVYYHRKDEAVTRIGISVSKKNGNAVTRNKIKRQVRATIATAYSLNKPLDIIIIVRASYDPKEYSSENSELLGLLTSIGDNNIEKKH